MGPGPALCQDHRPYSVWQQCHQKSKFLVLSPHLSENLQCVCANCQLPRVGGDSIHALFVPVAVL